MKTLIIIFMLLVSVPAMSQKTGYLIVVDDGKRIEQTKTTNLADVYTIAEVVFPGNCIDFSNELTKSPYFQMYVARKGIYIERKKVSKNGRFKRVNK